MSRVSDEIRLRLQALPAIDELIRAVPGLPRWAVTDAARRLVEERRQAILRGVEVAAIAPDEVAAAARTRLRPSLARVINATGVVLHTNLGRAPLAGRAAERAAAVAAGYSNLEYEGGSRGSRHAHVRAHLCALTGAEDALVTNNGAAAVLVTLAALGGGREAIVSRGELIEIGGSFRIPEVMRAGGVRLVEVGTTNKTRAADYRAAIGPETALLMKVHRSNFVQLGFVEDAEVGELAGLGLPLVVDLGSGALGDVGAWGLPPEPTVASQLAAGATVVIFSGDKLLGGPQAGIVVGRRAEVAKIASHPLMRAVRPDKLTVAALEATLELHREGRLDEIPALRALALPAAELRARAERLAAAAPGVRLVELASTVGGGALPTAELPSWGVALPGNAEAADAALRAGDPAIVGRIVDDALVLDVRTLLDDELDACVRVLQTRPPP